MDVPPFPKTRPWIYEWDDTGLSLDDSALDSLIDSLDLERSYRVGPGGRIDQIDQVIDLFNAVNSSEIHDASRSQVALRNGFFLVLYDLFCGRSSMKLLNKNAGASFATMCLAMLPDVYQSLGDARALVEQRQNKGVLSSLLLTLYIYPRFDPNLNFCDWVKVTSM